MKQASLTRHARRRIRQRCSLSNGQLKRILDGGGGIPILLQGGGRKVHRLIYSPKDEDWFMVVQAGDDGGVLTVMPLDFLEGRTEVTAADKRQARHRAIVAMRPAAAKRACQKPAAPAAAPPPKPVAQPAPIAPTQKQAATPPAAPPKPVFVPPRPLPGWKIYVSWTAEGKARSKNLSRPPLEYGEPFDWRKPGPIHQWFKERLAESGIPIAAVHQVWGLQSDTMVILDQLLDRLLLTAEETDKAT